MNATRLTFPGPVLRPVPPFSIDCPDGFGPIDAAESLAAFILRDTPPPFSATIVVGWERLDSALGLEEIARQTLADATASHAAFAVERERTVVVHELPAVARLQSFDEPRIDRRLAQLVVLVLLPPMGTGATRDLIHLTGTCLADDADTLISVFEATAESIEFFPEGS